MQKILQGSEVNPTSDGEDRFFAGVFLCFGVALLWCARDLQRRRVYLNFLAAAFFVGGVGRLLSVSLSGRRTRGTWRCCWSSWYYRRCW
ncbi:MAG TPA: DUF4345 domain-containing protein [Mycobacterium sp.]